VLLFCVSPCIEGRDDDLPTASLTPPPHHHTTQRYPHSTPASEAANYVLHGPGSGRAGRGGGARHAVRGCPRSLRPSLWYGRSECRWLLHGLGAPRCHPGRAFDGREQRGDGGLDVVDRDGEAVSVLWGADGRMVVGREEGAGMGTGHVGIDGTRHVVGIKRGLDATRVSHMHLSTTSPPSIYATQLHHGQGV